MLGIEALAIVDRNSLAGIVRAHEAAKTIGVRLIVGYRVDLADGMSILAYPADRPTYLQGIADHARGFSPDLSRLPRRACGNPDAEASYEWSSFRKRTDHVQLSRESATLTPSVEGR